MRGHRKIVDELAQLAGQRSSQLDPYVGPRLRKSEAGGVQKVSTKHWHRDFLPLVRRAATSSGAHANLRSRSIEGVAHNGVADGREMDANLMRSPGMQLDF